MVLMRRKTFMTLLGLALMVPLSSCETPLAGSISSESGVSSQESLDSLSSSESISVDPYTSPVTDIPHGKPTSDKLNFVEDADGVGVVVKPAARDISGEVVIPTSYGRWPVTAVYGFFECNNITSIYIPKGVKRIYGQGIFNCENLETVFISETIDSVTTGNFLSCPKLRVIVSDKSEHYSSLGGAFYDKTKTEILWSPMNVTSVSIPNTVERIGNAAFKGCHLETIDMPNGNK